MRTLFQIKPSHRKTRSQKTKKQGPRHFPPQGSAKHGLYLIARQGLYKVGCGHMAHRLWDQRDCQILGLFSTGDTRQNFELELQLHEELIPSFDRDQSEWIEGEPSSSMIEMFSTQAIIVRRPHGKVWEPCEVGRVAELGLSSGRDSLRFIV